MLTIKDLASARAQEAKENHKTYKHILELCHIDIKRRFDNKFTDCDFTVPGIIIGKPLFDVKRAIKYIEKKLSIGGFDVKIVSDNTIHIDWSDLNKHVVKKKPATPRPSNNKKIGWDFKTSFKKFLR